MEKYRSTADPSTGIHPYLPQPAPSSPLLHKLLSPFLFILRLPLFLLALILLILLTPLLIIPSFLSRLVIRLIARVLLLSLGATRLSPPSLPKSRLRVKGKAVTFPPPSAGELVITNLNGAVGVLQLVTAYAPVFLVPLRDGLAMLTLRQLTSLIATGKSPSGLLLVDVEAVLTSARTPVVLLAEGGASNGRGVLRFAPAALACVVQFARKGDGQRMFALGLPPRLGQEHWGVGKSFARYLVGLMGEVATDITATYVEVLPKDIAGVHAAVARCAGIPELAVGADLRDEFDRHWAETGGMSR